MRLGIHMPLKGGFASNLLRLKAAGCRTVQIFPGNPTGWKMSAPNAQEIQGRVELLAREGISPLVIHSAYLINLASIVDDFHRKSVELLRQTMAKASLYRSPYVVLHTGNHGGAGIERGIEKIIATIEEERKHWPAGVKLLLENTAGSGTALGSRLDELAAVINAFPKGTLGLCLDTAHAWAAGYDLSTAGGSEEMLEQVDKLLGLDCLQVIHANDARVERGSRVDRHEHIGLGRMGLDGLRALLRYPWPADFPVILETPEIGGPWDEKNLDTLHSLSAGDL